jgi:hypothetical protein
MSLALNNNLIASLQVGSLVGHWHKPDQPGRSCDVR